MPMTVVDTEPAVRDGYLQSMLDWQSLYAENLLQAQRYQSAWMCGCFTSVLAFNQECWDQWVARYGGGVPLDG